MFKLYALMDGEMVKYIGITSRTLKDRLRGHISDIKRNKNPKKCQWLKEMILLNKRVEIKLLIDNLTKEEALIKEVEYISTYENLLNATTGGHYCETTEDVKQRLSEIQINKYQNGYINPMKGKKRKDLTKINEERSKEFYKELGHKNSDKFKIMFNTPEYKKNFVMSQKTRREVNQFDMDGNFIRKWDSIRRVCDYFKSENRGLRTVYKSVSNCCSGKKKSAYNFRWSYA